MGIGVRYTVDDNHTVREIHKVVVYKFNMSDVEDPDLWAAQSLYEWERSEAGQFVMQNAIDQPRLQRHHDPMFMGWTYIVIAEIEKKRYSEFLLRFGQKWK